MGSRLSPGRWWWVALHAVFLQGGVTQGEQPEARKKDIKWSGPFRHIGHARKGAQQHSHKWFSPNPPACAEEISAVIWDLSEIASNIIQETRLCSQGYFGIDDQPGLPNWHEPQLCANRILQTFAFTARGFADFFAASFDCFNSNQACGQSIGQIIRALMEAIDGIIDATRLCEPPGTAPNYWNTDLPQSGLMCWWRVWHSVERLMKAAKFIDVAVDTCGAASPTGGAEAGGNNELVGQGDATGNSTIGNETNSERLYHARPLLYCCPWPEHRLHLAVHPLHAVTDTGGHYGWWQDCEQERVGAHH